MRRASTNSSAILLSGGRSSPHDGSTPLIEDDSNHPYSSKRSTPCPPRPAAASLTDSEATQQPPSSTRATPSDREVSTQPEHHARNGDAAATWEGERNLTDSIISLRQKLDASTALVDRVHLRNEVIRLDNVLNEKRLQEARSEQEIAMEKACMATEQTRKSQVVLGSMLCFLLLGLLVYVNWLLFYSPEVSYVRQRRRAVLGL